MVSRCAYLGSNQRANSVCDRKRLPVKSMMKTRMDNTSNRAYVNPKLDFSSRFSSLRITIWYRTDSRSVMVFLGFNAMKISPKLDILADYNIENLFFTFVSQTHS